jgi:1,4-dihydroxy-2-naphthoate octaprenyltransferase
MIKIWIQAARPKTLSAAICPVLIGSVLAYSENCWSLITFLFTLLTALAIQIGTNFANDYFDFRKGADTAARKGPQRIMQAGLVTTSQMKRAIFAIFFLAALLGIYLIIQGGVLFAFLLGLAIALGILYTAGPFSLAYLGLGDLFVLVFFGPVATLGTYLLQTQKFSLDAALVGLGPGALSWAILLMNNLRDVEEDRIAGKKTLCVRGGLKLGKSLYLFCVLCAFLLPLIWIQEHPFVLLASLISLMAFPLARQTLKNSDPEVFASLFVKTALLLPIYTLLFCLGWLL